MKYIMLKGFSLYFSLVLPSFKVVSFNEFYFIKPLYWNGDSCPIFILEIYFFTDE